MSDPGDPIQIQHTGRATIVRAGPEFTDGRRDDELDRRLAEIVVRESPQVLLLDVSEIDYVNSHFLATVLRVHKLQSKRGPFALCGARPNLLHVLRTCGLDQIISSHPSAEAAVEQMNAGGQDLPARE